MNLTFSALKIPASGTLGITVGDKGLGALGKKLNEMTGGALERAMKNSSFKAGSKRQADEQHTPSPLTLLSL